jgi:hypothetical protein
VVNIVTPMRRGTVNNRRHHGIVSLDGGVAAVGSDVAELDPFAADGSVCDAIPRPLPAVEQSPTVAGSERAVYP